MINVEVLKSFDLIDYKSHKNLPSLQLASKEPVIKMDVSDAVKLVCVDSMILLTLTKTAVGILVQSLNDSFLSDNLLTDAEQEHKTELDTNTVRMLHEFGLSDKDIEKYSDFATASSSLYKSNRRSKDGVRCLASKNNVYIFISETRYVRIDKHIIVRMWISLTEQGLGNKFDLTESISIQKEYLDDISSLDTNYVGEEIGSEVLTVNVTKKLEEQLA